MDVWKNGNARFGDYVAGRGTPARGTLEMLLGKLSKAENMRLEGKDQSKEIANYLRIVEERVLSDLLNEYQGQLLAPENA